MCAQSQWARKVHSRRHKTHVALLHGKGVQSEHLNDVEQPDSGRCMHDQLLCSNCGFST